MHGGVYVATEVLAPAAFKVPRYELAGLTLLGITWSLGFIWMYARLYAYNRGALGAFIALVTKIAWCVFPIHFAFQGGASIANPNTEDGREALSNSWRA